MYAPKFEPTAQCHTPLYCDGIARRCHACESGSKRKLSGKCTRCCVCCARNSTTSGRKADGVRPAGAATYLLYESIAHRLRHLLIRVVGHLSLHRKLDCLCAHPGHPHALSQSTAYGTQRSRRRRTLHHILGHVAVLHHRRWRGHCASRCVPQRDDEEKGWKATVWAE